MTETVMDLALKKKFPRSEVKLLMAFWLPFAKNGYLVWMTPVENVEASFKAG